MSGGAWCTVLTHSAGRLTVSREPDFRHARKRALCTVHRALWTGNARAWSPCPARTKHHAAAPCRSTMHRAVSTCCDRSLRLRWVAPCRSTMHRAQVAPIDVGDAPMSCAGRSILPAWRQGCAEHYAPCVSTQHRPQHSALGDAEVTGGGEVADAETGRSCGLLEPSLRLTSLSRGDGSR